MYIQYFCKKDFSGTGTMGSPSAVSGGGVVSSGKGGYRGPRTMTVVFNRFNESNGDCFGEEFIFGDLGFGQVPS